MPMPSARRDRWLALALLLAVLGLAYLLLVHPWFTQPLREIDADVAALREREARVQAQLQQQPQIEQRLRATREALQQRPGFLREATAEAADRTEPVAGPDRRYGADVWRRDRGERVCRGYGETCRDGDGCRAGRQPSR